jgi:protein-S-isoprenylcysteine O-methyltransferase Ste14
MRRLIIPPLIFALAALAMLALDRFVPGSRLIPAEGQDLAGAIAILLAVAGLVLAGAALATFQRAGTSPKPWAEPTALVTGGPYRFSRNPMYLALLLLLAGLALALGTLTPVLVLPVFIIAVDRLFIRREERLLAGRFAAEFAAWRTRVRRWL